MCAGGASLGCQSRGSDERPFAFGSARGILIQWDVRDAEQGSPSLVRTSRSCCRLKWSKRSTKSPTAWGSPVLAGLSWSLGTRWETACRSGGGCSPGAGSSLARPRNTHCPCCGKPVERGRCRECRRAVERVRSRRRGVRPRRSLAELATEARTGLRRCTCCGCWRPFVDFYRRKGGRLESACRLCLSAKAAARQRALRTSGDPRFRRLRAAQYRRRDERRRAARLAAGGETAADRCPHRFYRIGDPPACLRCGRFLSVATLQWRTEPVDLLDGLPATEEML